MHSCRVRSLVVLLAAMYLGRIAHAQWERMQEDWSGEGGIGETISRQSPAHPLEFYLTPSAERDFDHSLCLGCDAGGGHRTELQDFSIQTSKRVIGQYRGGKILQIALSFRYSPAAQERFREEAAREHSGGDTSPDGFKNPFCEWKSIIVEDSPGLYRELYFLIDSGTWIRPLSEARLVTAGDAHVIETVDPFSFNMGGCTEGYWVLEPAGPQLIDFSAVHAELKRVVPPDAAPDDRGCDALAMDKLLVSSPVRSKHPDCETCGYVGTATVHFRLDGNRAIPVSSSFVPGEPD